MTEYELPNISVDVVPVTLNNTTGKLEIVLGRRQFEPHLGEFALPGVLLTPHERLNEAAYRAMQTKVAIEESEVITLLDLGTFDNPDRDPRGATVSIAKIAIVNPVGEIIGRVTSEPIDILVQQDIPLPFDHTTIVESAATLLSEKLLSHKALTKALLGDTFSTKTLRIILSQLQGIADENNRFYDPSNLTRQLKGTNWFAPVENEKDSLPLSATTTRGRPSRVWKWV